MARTNRIIQAGAGQAVYLYDDEADIQVSTEAPVMAAIPVMMDSQTQWAQGVDQTAETIDYPSNIYAPKGDTAYRLAAVTARMTPVTITQGAHVIMLAAYTEIDGNEKAVQTGDSIRTGETLTLTNAAEDQWWPGTVTVNGTALTPVSASYWTPKPEEYTVSVGTETVNITTGPAKALACFMFDGTDISTVVGAFQNTLEIFDLDTDGSLMPSTDRTASAFFDVDTNGDLMPKEV